MADEENWTVNEWLESFGFERYLTRFLDNGYETRKLCSKLKPEDLDEMEISDLPHRAILFNQSDMLRTGQYRPSSIQSNSGSSSLDKVPTPSPASPSSLASSDFNSETYSTVFDDISSSEPSSKYKTAPPLLKTVSKKKTTASSSSVDHPDRVSTTAQKNKRSAVSTGLFKHHSLSLLNGSPKTKLELKLVIRELVQRDGLILNGPPYCNEVSKL